MIAASFQTVSQFSTAAPPLNQLGKRRFIGASRAGQDAPPFSATQAAENAGAGRPPNVSTGPAPSDFWAGYPTNQHLLRGADSRCPLCQSPSRRS